MGRESVTQLGQRFLRFYLISKQKVYLHGEADNSIKAGQGKFKLDHENNENHKMFQLRGITLGLLQNM